MGGQRERERERDMDLPAGPSPVVRAAPLEAQTSTLATGANGLE